jgi:hypothetical protein
VALPTDFQKTWQNEDVTLVLGPCATGEECGWLDWPTWPTNDDARCINRLALRSVYGTTAEFDTVDDTSPGCEGTSWPEAAMEVFLLKDGGVAVSRVGVSGPSSIR